MERVTWLLGVATFHILSASAVQAHDTGRIVCTDPVQDMGTRNWGCKTPPLRGWTTTEKCVWRCLCAGGMADLRHVQHKETFLSESFLSTVMFASPYKDALTHRGVQIIGARFAEPVDLSDGVLPRRVVLSHSTFESGIRLRRVSSEGLLALRDSKILGAANFSFSRLYQVELGGTELQSLAIASTIVEKQLVLLAAKISGHANFFTTRFNDSVYLNEVEVGSLEMVRASIRGDLHLRGASLGRADLRGVEIEGSLWLGDNKRDKRCRLWVPVILGRDFRIF